MTNEIRDWIAQYGQRGTVDDPYAEDDRDGLNFWRGLCWAVPVGCAFWAGVAWLFS